MNIETLCLIQTSDTSKEGFLTHQMTIVYVQKMFKSFRMNISTYPHILSTISLQTKTSFLLKMMRQEMSYCTPT